MRASTLSRRAAVLAAVATSIGAVPSTDRGPRALLVVGDSWAAGLYADPQHALGQVAAARLGWAVTVDAVSGTGYVNGAADQRSYVDRLAGLDDAVRADVVVLQGGSNDKASSPTQLAEAADRALVLAHERFSAARLVVLGPGPDPVPVTPDQVAVDRTLTRVAAARLVPYISPLRRHWISQRHPDSVLDPGNHHPTVAGQRYLGRRLAQSIRHL